jgi:metal-responsive CopG/Arc/MetJ family transcriptional regulator
MDEQLTVRIPAALGRALRRASRQLQRKNSEIVREALQAFLQTHSAREAPAARAKHLVGSLESGVPDLATRHREYLLERLRRGR